MSIPDPCRQLQIPTSVLCLGNAGVYGIFAGEMYFLTAEKRRNKGYVEEYHLFLRTLF